LFVNSVGYFINNLKALKGIPKAIKDEDKEKVKDIFSGINDKSNGVNPIIPVPTGLTIINKGNSALGSTESIINDVSNGNGFIL
jgi:hypothetical protein